MAFLDDADGIFWTDEQYKARGNRERPDELSECAKRLPSIPMDQYTYEFRELREPPSGFLAFDYETYDPTLTDIGSASAFIGEGETLGFAVAWEDFEAYWPYGHNEGNAGPKEKYIDWLRRQAKREDITFVCANAVYDMGWLLRDIGFLPVGGIVDVQHMAALLDENRTSYSLDSLGKIYLQQGKEKDVIEYVMGRLGYKIGIVMQCLRHMPGWALGHYASKDGHLTYKLAAMMLPLIEKENLRRVFEVESALIPMSVAMRMRGMRVNVARAEQVADDLHNVQMPALQAEIERLSGIHVEPWQAETIVQALHTIGINYGRTRTGMPRVDAKSLEEDAKKHPLCAHILRLRKMAKVESTFLRGHILAHARNGRVHAEINQLRSERDSGSNFGTVTGRYSVTNPGLQQIPVRDKEFGSLVRSMFEAEDGEEICSIDYSSQEPRLAVHFAALARIPKADEAVAAFNNNPKMDYHQFVADICGIDRPKAKTLNLGLAYGMGGAKLAHALGLPTEWFEITNTGNGRSKWTPISAAEVPYYSGTGNVVEVAGPEAKAIIDKWEAGAPFIRGLFRKCHDTAASRGFILTLLKRRCRFPMEQGLYNWTHKAMNRLCQSSAADQLKLGLLSLWKDGLVPLIPIHDEIVFSTADRAQVPRIAQHLQEAYQLLVPTVVDVKYGKNWGEIPK